MGDPFRDDLCDHAALRAAMPQVIVSKQAPIDVDLRPTTSKVLEAFYVAAAVAALGGVAYFFCRAFIG